MPKKETRGNLLFYPFLSTVIALDSKLSLLNTHHCFGLAVEHFLQYLSFCCGLTLGDVSTFVDDTNIKNALSAGAVVNTNCISAEE